jgi:hypothetical protein
MTDAAYRQARAAVIAGGDPPPALMDECRTTVRLLVRTAGLPPFYSPLGVWSEEAIEEVHADWVAIRLIGRGQLRAILQRSPTLPVFRRMAETSIRQHLIDGLERTQSANLYERTERLLRNAPGIAGTGTGGGRLWHTAAGTSEPFQGDDRRLLAVAWALGAFTVIRYDPDAKKLSPLLDTPELERFVTGMLTSGAMTLATVMRALQMRFSLDDHAAHGEFDPQRHARAGGDPVDGAIVADLVTATLAELTGRQANVLLGASSGTPVRRLANQLGCSTGTISHERAQVAAILARLGADAPAVLNEILDALLIDD